MIRLLQWRQQMDAREYEQMKRADAVEKYLHGTASRALADRIVRDHAFQMKEKDRDEQDPWGGMRHTFTFSIGVADRSEAGDLAKQIEEARAEGMRMAADIVRAAAARFHRLDEGCAPVIASSLAEAARAVDRSAEEMRAHYAHSVRNEA